MRRLAATFLLLLTGILPIQPLVAQAEAQANIPVCCRAHGAHHCMMMQMALGMDAPISWMAQPCPYARLRHAVTTTSSFLHAAVGISAYRPVSMLDSLSARPTPDTQHSSLYAPRGPPAFLL